MYFELLAATMNKIKPNHPLSGLFLEKVRAFLLLNKFASIPETRKFITVFSRIRRCSLCCLDKSSPQLFVELFNLERSGNLKFRGFATRAVPQTDVRLDW
jgi:hypothetical protein